MKSITCVILYCADNETAFIGKVINHLVTEKYVYPSRPLFVDLVNVGQWQGQDTGDFSGKLTSGHLFKVKSVVN